MDHYKASGIIFYNERSTSMQVFLFAKAVVEEPQSSVLWYILGESLHFVSAATGRPAWQLIGMACIKKSLELDPKNPRSQHFINTVSSEGFSTAAVADLEMVSKISDELTTAQLIAEFDALKSTDDKIKLVMHLGETGDDLFFEFLRHCILNAENENIRFAALKRIGNFKKGQLKDLFDEIVSRGQVSRNEPYFSIALSTIDASWAATLINPEYARQPNKPENYTDEEIDRSLNDQELSTMIIYALSKYNSKEIQQLTTQRNHKIIAYYLTHRLNNEGLQFLLEKNILSKQAEVTSLGWKHVEDYLKKTDAIEQAATQNTTVVAENTTLVAENTTSSPKKKWWKIWD